MKTLIIDDQKSICYSLQRVLENKGYDVNVCYDGESGLKEILKGIYDVVFLDIRLPDISGLEILKIIKDTSTINSKIIIMTAFHESDIAVDSIKYGAYDYIIKPFDNNELEKILNKITSSSNNHEVKQLCIEKDNGKCSDKIISNSTHMIEVIKKIGKLSQSDESVLITGETGTGKDIIAKAIHNYSSRSSKNFVAINCSALPRELLESELFGYEKGAFTGADRTYIGKIEYANSGTLFLDEIGDMPIEIQAKLLRVLQNKTITKLGSNKSIDVNVRIISATNKNLNELISKGLFRQDLYYRLNTYEIHLLPLRERKEDIIPLVEYFVKKFSKKHITITETALNGLLNYDFPGNVRELENIVKRTLIESEDIVVNFKIPECQNNNSDRLIKEIINDFERKINKIGLKEYFGDLEEKIVRYYYNKNNCNQVKTSDELKIARNTLRKILKID